MYSREKLEEELKIYKERLEGAMEAGDFAWWEMELPSGEVVFNETKAKILGYSPEKFEHYTDFTDLLHPEDQDRAMKAMKNHLEGRKKRYEVEYRIQKKSGNYKWFRDIGRITEEGEKDDYRKVTGVVIDIDEWKKTERELQTYADVFDDVPVGLHIYQLEKPDDNSSLRMIYANKITETYTSIPVEEVVGKTMDESFPELRKMGVPQV
ncbi:hypothetical protein C9439_00170 [archaeon SCG-AAA382B04]|nr:hypothetical protein C9439_00170 [archaeon SCG-AAA382B04]